MLGEYFRQFVSYGVIALALVLYEWKRVTQEHDSRATLRGEAARMRGRCRMTASLIQRSAVIVGLLLLSVFLFYIGKGHTLLIDTNAVTIGDKEYRSAETVSVSINGQPAETMGAGPGASCLPSVGQATASPSRCCRCR